MKKFVLILGLCLWSYSATAENKSVSGIYDDTEYYEHIKESVKKFKDILKSNNPELIAQNVVYPYSLGWGVPSIHNEKEFIEKYDIILPEYLREYLIDSPDNQWDSGQNLGGICLNYCPDAHLTYDGEILSVKDTEELKKYRKEYIENEKQIIHPSLKEYNYNLYTMETKDWLIRIDDMKGLYEIYTQIDIPNIYRFTAWKKGKTISDEPDIVIDRGHTEQDPEFRYSPEYYIFNNSDYHAIFTNDPVGPKEHMPYYIEIYKNFCSETPNMIIK